MKIERLLSELGSHVRDAVIITEAEPISTPGPRVIWCNDQFSEMTGYGPDEIIGRTPRILQGKDTDPAAIASISEKLRSWKPVRQEILNYKKNGEPFWVDLSITPVADETGWFWYWLSFQRDITEQKRFHEEAQEAREEADLANSRLLSAIEALPDAFVLYDRNDHLVLCNEQYRELYRESRQMILPGARFEDILRYGLARGQYAEAVGREEEWLAERLAAHGQPKAPAIQHLADDRFVRVHEVRTALGDTVGVRVDVSEIIRQRQQIERYADALQTAKEESERQAHTDALTGLLNRRAIEVLVDNMEQTASPADRLAVLHIDLDRFKQINDTLGHAAGDAVLTEVAKRLTEAVRAGDLVGRMGGDEFIVFCLGVDACEARVIADRIVSACAEPAEIDGQPCRLSASVGIACAPARAIRSTVVDADIALYRAKDQGRNTTAAFSIELKKEMAEKRRTFEQIVEGLEQGAFIPYFQPQLDARTMRLSGLEALARWRHPEDGIVAPNRFLKVADEMALIGRIDAQIFDAAMYAMIKIRALGGVAPKLSVNVSLRRLLDPELMEVVERWRPEPSTLAFELLETALFDDMDEAVARVLSELRQRGVAIEVDDFGSGHASISGLLQILPNSLKIDRSIVRSATQKPEHARLLEAIVEIGQTLGISTIAEGVETDEDISAVRSAGCDHLQGYAIARPMPLDALIGWLTEENWLKGLNAVEEARFRNG